MDIIPSVDPFGLRQVSVSKESAGRNVSRSFYLLRQTSTATRLTVFKH